MTQPDQIVIDGILIPQFIYAYCKRRARLSGLIQFIGITSMGRQIIGFDRDELKEGFDPERPDEELTGILWISPYDKLDLMRPEVMA
jgi:hypothetical protein